MTAIAAPTVKDPNLVSMGLVESASVKSFVDFIPENLTKSEAPSEMEKDDFINEFICHLIFYAVFCVSLVLHILIDLGLGSFIKRNFSNIISLFKKTVFEKAPIFA